MEIKDLIEKFKQNGLEFNDGATIEQIIALETNLDFIFPDLFKQFYLQANGFKNDDWTEGMFSLFPLNLVERYNECEKNMWRWSNLGCYCNYQ